MKMKKLTIYSPRAIKSEKSHARLDHQSRIIKAKKIVVVLKEHANLKNASLLDIGTGSGHVIQQIAKHCKRATSVDLHDERLIKKGYRFKKVSDEHLPFEDNSFDVAISNHVLEHVPNQQLHLDEIHRVLKKGGIFYLATPNRWWYKDPHYKLPFITWLPRSIASILFKALKNKDWDIFSLSYHTIKKRTHKQFQLHNKTIDILKNPKKYHLDTLPKIQPMLAAMPRPIMNMLTPLLPTFILILKKR